ncbi:hypothetical protein [Endozoicomonas ascidiicola]|uniref:hypothetical protein n=1 Tax=Endozoicomonas ascidiicola TaxID=1698521 RepID=UPI000835701E|nr:hypothetical protein [Endozoicomonas ascidiicola]
MTQNIGHSRGLPLHQLPNNGLQNKQSGKISSGLLAGRKVITNAGVKQLLGTVTSGPGKKLSSRTARINQAKQYVKDVKTLNNNIKDQIKQNQQDAKSRRQALFERQKARQQRHSNIRRPNARSNNTGNKVSINKSPLGDVTIKAYRNIKSNNVQRIGQQSVGGAGIVKAQTRQGGAKLMASISSDNRAFLQGVKGLSTHVKVLQEQLKEASTPLEVKQTIANAKSSKLSPQQKSDFHNGLRSAIFRLVKNPDSAIKLDETFIRQALKGDSLATSTALNYFEKASIAHLEERSHLLKNGRTYSGPSHKPETNLSYKALVNQIAKAESINDLKAALDNKVRTEALTSAQKNRFNKVMLTVVTALAKNPNFVAELSDGFIYYALNGDDNSTQAVIKMRDNTIDNTLEQRLNNLRK